MTLSLLTAIVIASSSAVDLINFKPNTPVKADEMNRNFYALDSVKADRSVVQLLTTAVNAKPERADLTALAVRQDSLVSASKGAFSSKADTLVWKALRDSSSVLRGEMGKATGALSWDKVTGKPGLWTDDQDVLGWAKELSGTPVRAVRSNGVYDYGALVLMRRDTVSATVMDLHVDGFLDAGTTKGGLQTNSVTRIDGSGNGVLTTLRVGVASSTNNSPVSFRSTGYMWNEGPEVIAAPNGNAGMYFRSIGQDSSLFVGRLAGGSFSVGFKGLKGAAGQWGDVGLLIAPTGDAQFGSNLSVSGALSVKNALQVPTASIGTATIVDLVVSGVFRAKSTTPWADYVFEPGYQPMPLKEIEAYAKEHKHLPEMPSTAEVEKDGIDIAKMNAILLKKVEELTLHAVEQEKRMEALQIKMQALEGRSAR